MAKTIKALSTSSAGVPKQLYKGYVFDLDGTIYLGDKLLPGARRLVLKLRELGKKVAFLSMTRWLSQNHPDAVIFPIAEEPLKRALRKAGIRMSEKAEEIDLVVASYDRTFDYRKLQIAFDAIWYYKRARLLTTNPDRYCPFPGGRDEPDAAAIVAAIEACTGARCEANT